jgi:hypothetical protein
MLRTDIEALPAAVARAVVDTTDWSGSLPSQVARRRRSGR